MNPPIRVLVVDDERYVRESLAAMLASEGFEIETAESVKKALRALEMRRFDVVLSDLSMPHKSGIDLLRETRAGANPIPVVLVTGVGTVPDAVAAMKVGAFDFLQKPVDPDELVVVVRRAAEHKALVTEVRTLRERVRALPGLERIVGGSQAMTHVRAAIEQIAPRSVPVLISGETGTGKDLAAAEIHRRSDRALEPFVRVDCALSHGSSFESELFGRVLAPGDEHDPTSGFARARGGTLVLDAVDRLRPAFHARLERALASDAGTAAADEARRPDVRIIALSTADLAHDAKVGRFHADLYYRLAVLRLELPPLRRHSEDLPEIVAYFEHNARGVAEAREHPLASETLDVLSSYDWPGNVRELSNVIERARIVAGGARIDAELVRSILESAKPTAPLAVAREHHLRSNLDAREKQLLIAALERARGKKKEAAHLLGIDARNLGYYLRKHKLQDASENAGD